MSALRTERVSEVVSWGFEASESWGSFGGNASISTARAYRGAQSLKIDAGLGGSTTLLLGPLNAVGPMEGKECTARVYLESAPAGVHSLAIVFTAVGRIVSFSQSGNLDGLPLNEWTLVAMPEQIPSIGPLANLTSLRVSVNPIGGFMPVIYIDSISLGPGSLLRTRRTASAILMARRTASLDIVTRRT